MNLWWLSFADGNRPKGTQFLGACIVEGSDMVSAVCRAHFLKCNPGGEVAGVPIPEPNASHIRPEETGRLMTTREECDALGARVLARMGGGEPTA